MHSRSVSAAFIVVAIQSAVLCGCGGSAGLAPTRGNQLGAINQSAHKTSAPYTIAELETLGGTIAAGISITNKGAISGFSGQSANSDFHAALWEDHSSQPTDLKTLGGANSAVEWPNHSEREVVGISQTSSVDNLGETWSCSAFIPYTGNTCLGFVWHADTKTMSPLATLGGNNGYAASANSRESVVGWAETSVHDTTCIHPQVLQFEAVEWDRSGNPTELPPLSGDSDGAATTINDPGDVAGISGICQNAVGDLSAKHAVLWRNGSPTRIGDLGGAAWNTPAAMNDSDEVVGFSDLPGDDNGNSPNFHAFRWTSTDGIRDLGTLSGDKVSEALGINENGLIVGLSCMDATCSSSRAVIWKNDHIIDLNGLVPAGSPFLVYANDVNDRGEITGLAIDPSTGNALAFRAIPAGEEGGELIQAHYGAGASRPVPEEALRRLGLHFGAFGRIVRGL